ncbi:MAG: hypothetical protein ACPGSO_05280 [Vicingaceae bacterium]
MNKLIFIIALSLTPFLGFSQNIGAGGSLLYNVQSESFGGGARVSFLPDSKVSFVPQFSYFFIGPVNEWTAGLSIELKWNRRKHVNYYILAHGGFNRWTNHEESAMKDASPNNLNLEGGIGISGTRCLRPFLEYRYNLKFQETHFQLGLLYIFGCKKNSGGYRNRTNMKNGVKCFNLF